MMKAEGENMDFYTVLNKRRTIRDFADKTVDTGIIERIIDAGIKAPSDNHLRDSEFIVITDAAQKQEVIRKVPKNLTYGSAQINPQEYHKQMYADAYPKQYKMLEEAPCLIIPMYRHRLPISDMKTLSHLNTFATIWCCIENMMLAAAAEGIACALRIPFEDEVAYVQQISGAPHDYTMACYLALGYPADDAVMNRQFAFDPQDKMHWNKW